MSRKLTQHQYERLKCLAAELIEDYGLTYPLEPLEIADNLGVLVTMHPDGLPPTAANCSTTDGYTEPTQSRHGWKLRIHANSSAPLLRQRFTLMHEIAHIWLDHPRSDASLTEERAEAEANFLASYLLAPDALVIEWVPDLTVLGIADVFVVSDEAAQIIHGRVLRAKNLDAIGRPHDRRILSSATRQIDTPTAIARTFLGLA